MSEYVIERPFPVIEEMQADEAIVALQFAMDDVQNGRSIDVQTLDSAAEVIQRLQAHIIAWDRAFNHALEFPDSAAKPTYFFKNDPVVFPEAEKIKKAMAYDPNKDGEG